MRRSHDQDGRDTILARPHSLRSIPPTTNAPGWPTMMPASKSSRRLARVLDVAIAGTLLIALSPLMAVIAVLIRLISPGPVLFRQVRVGYLEHPFVLLKFRTMYTNSDDKVHRDYVTRMLTEDPVSCQQSGLFKLADDPRITRVGAFLRCTSLDELPQLVNVLQGDMSLVGPRPALPWEVALYKHHHYRMRFQVRPGITGLWQVRGRSRLSMNEALELDVEYAKRRSLSLDLWILIMTLPAVIARDRAR
jgi:lipopolysaccharide/colanic/teichoic acid biosynthesis glycosyltransferase